MPILQPIRSQAIDALHRIAIVVDLPVQDRDQIIRLSQQILPCRVGELGQQRLLRAIADIPALEREGIVLCVRQLIFDSQGDFLIALTEVDSQCQILEILVAIPAHEREGLISLSKQVMTDYTDMDDRLLILAAIGALRVDERQDVLAHVQQLMGSTIRVEAITTIGTIPAEERGDFIRFAQQIITEQTRPYDRSHILEMLATIPAREREAIVRHALEMLVGETENDRGCLLKALFEIPPMERDGVIQSVMRLIHEQLSVQTRRTMIELISTIPLQERDAVVLYARRALNPPNPDERGVVEGVGRGAILRAIIAIPSEDRADVIRHAVQLITPRANGILRSRIIRDIAQIPMDQRGRFVREQQNRYEPIDLPRINVHAANRDQKTKEAILLLYRIQGCFSLATLQQATDEFIAYIHVSSMSLEKRQLALHALLQPKQPWEDFGPLLDEENFSLLGLSMSGVSLIGRLWIFASELIDREQINAKEGMIAALRDSYEERRRVCNQGKTQRLVIAVLQGRLLGVDIEENQSTQVCAGQALEVFFHVQAHRNFQTLCELEAGARRFCNENPSVNREEFLHAIYAYAEQQDIV